METKGYGKTMPKKRFRSSSEEIRYLENEIQITKPPSGKGLSNDSPDPVPFNTLPLSEQTLSGLSFDKKINMTDIQKATILHALSGRDILASATTGSGKTLAFLIPTIERLYRHEFSCSPLNGAIVLSPTRELASQIFVVLRVIGKLHSLSAGLVIGGAKEFKREQNYVGRSNILVATPGRLLHHLEQSPNFDTSAVEIIVLDEADRILDMGFQLQLERILDYMPQERQTLLFSATQTKKVKDLARLSLRRPEYIFVHSSKHTDTSIVASLPPASLEQLYMVVPLEHKLDLLYSFLKSHVQSRIIIFFATCSQVRHAYELFCSLRPGIPLWHCMASSNKKNERMYIRIFSKNQLLHSFQRIFHQEGWTSPT